MTKKKTAHTGGTVKGGGNEKRYSKNSTTESAAQPVYSADGKRIGTIDGDTLTKHVKGSKHMLRTPRAWALDADVLFALPKQGVRCVVYIDTETGHTYSTSVETFTRKGKSFNRGFGPQVFLPLGYWSIDGHPSQLIKREPDPDAPRQLPLFAEADA